MTGQFRFEDLQLPQPVRKLWILRRCSGILNGLIETPGYLLERIVVSFHVSPGQVSIRARSVLHKGRVLHENLIVGIPIAEPQLIRSFLIPGYRSFGSVDFDTEAV